MRFRLCTLVFAQKRVFVFFLSQPLPSQRVRIVSLDPHPLNFPDLVLCIIVPRLRGPTNPCTSRDPPPLLFSHRRQSGVVGRRQMLRHLDGLPRALFAFSLHASDMNPNPGPTGRLTETADACFSRRRDRVGLAPSYCNRFLF